MILRQETVPSTVQHEATHLDRLADHLSHVCNKMHLLKEYFMGVRAKGAITRGANVVHLVQCRRYCTDNALAVSSVFNI